jgi:hypothetical protein
VNVRHLLILPTLLLISGCASFGWNSSVKPIEVQTKAVERTRLNLADPAPLKGRELNWIVVTPENAEEVWKKLKEENTDLVLFAITDDGYEQLALSMAELRNFIAQQRAIIVKYKEYYEPPKTPDSK